MQFLSCRIASLAVLITLVFVTCPVAAVTLRIDYSKDSNNFFPAGSQARATMEAVATFYSGILEDTLSAIDTPPKYLGSRGGEVTWHWRRSYLNPSGGGTIFETDVEKDLDIDANEYVVFVGARDLVGGDLALGGAGGILWTSVENGQFTTNERTEWTAIRDQFTSAVEKRQETTGFASWGGGISFDSNANWHFNHTTNPGAGTQDFYSVALHELGHVLGLGTSETWNGLLNTAKTKFTGANAESAFGDDTGVPLGTDDTGHWQQSIADSTVFGGGASQKPLMVSEIAPAIRRQLTDLDAAALVDLGWEIDLPMGMAAATLLVSSGNSSGSASFAALSAMPAAATTVPEPGGMVLAALAAMFASALGSRSASRRG